MIIARSNADRNDAATGFAIDAAAAAVEPVAAHNEHGAPHGGHTGGDTSAGEHTSVGGHTSGDTSAGEPTSGDTGAAPDGHGGAPNAATLHEATRLLAHERWQMATDVHDLIMQDLSLALANARALSDDPAATSRVGIVADALERALAGARDVVSGLSRHDTGPIAQTIEASVRTAARHTPVRFDAARVSASAQPDQPTRAALVHIAREAVTNAVKHARPNAIDVVLEHADRWRLTVRDDGLGFQEAPPANPAVGGFGLVSMRESAHALGGAVHIGSLTGAGTTVEAVLP